MSKRFAPLVCAALLAALLFSLSAAAAPAEPQPYYPTGGVAEYTLTEVPATGDAPLTLQDDRSLEEIIVEGLRNVKAEISIPSGMLPFTTQDEIRDIYFAIVRAHPEFFYVGNSAGFFIQSGYVVSFSPQYDQALSQSSVISAFNARVEEILDETIAPGMSQVEMALSLHDYLVLHCAYDWNVANRKGASSYNVYTAYGALMEGNAVCQGYAMAYNLLLNMVGIKTDYVTSVIPNQGSHGWSLVKIGETWYHVDVTWDDPTPSFSGYSHDLPGFCDHSYFLVSTAKMKEKHGIFTVTQETGTTYESGYVFCDASVPFFFLDGQFYYIGEDDHLHSTENLQKGAPASIDPVLAQRHGSTIFFRNYYYSTTIYGYDTVTKQRYSVATLSSTSGYGLQEYDDGVYLVEIPGGPGVTKGPKLQLPLDGSLHCNDPVVSSSAVTVSIQNGLSEERTVSLCLAAYDETGQLLSLDWEDVLVPSGESKQATFALPQGSEAKVFYLGEALRPLRGAATVQP